MLERLRVAVAVVLVGGLAVWLVTNLKDELRTGVARARRRTYHERSTPGLYWLNVGVQMVFLVLCLILLAQLAARLFT